LLIEPPPGDGIAAEVEWRVPTHCARCGGALADPEPGFTPTHVRDKQQGASGDSLLGRRF